MYLIDCNKLKNKRHLIVEDFTLCKQNALNYRKFKVCLKFPNMKNLN